AVKRITKTVHEVASRAKNPEDEQRAIVEKVTEGVKPQEARRAVKADAIAARKPEEFTGKYRVIYADPPWKYGNTQVEGFREQRDHYPVMDMADICALPVADLAEDDAVLFLWVTSPILDESVQVVNPWAFK